MYYGEPQDNAPAFSLTIISGGESGQRFVFAQPEVTLGRIADNDLVLYDAAVSRRHLVFYYRNNQFILEDLGSSNGSQLNGVPVTQPTVLCEHDVLDVGSVRFQFSTDNVSEYDDNDDPTEIELGAIQGSAEALPAAKPQEEVGPLVRARWEASNGGPLPPEGDTRQFAAHQIRGAGGPIPPPQRGGPLGPASGQMPNPGATMDPQALMASPQPAAPAPHRPSPTGMGIRPPSHPPPQQPRPPQPEQRFNPHAAPPSGQFAAAAPPSGQFAAAPPSGQFGAVPPPAAPAPASTPLQLPQQLGGLGSRGNPNSRQDKQLQLMERRRIRNASIWSAIALAAVVALFFIPLPTQKQHKSPPISKGKSILYNNATHKRYFGYNNKDQKHPKQVTIQIFYRGGRARVSYNVISPEPVTVLLNGKELATVDPTKGQWHYDRHTLPRAHLKQGYNRITFVRNLNPKKLTIWGVTLFKYEETTFPPADFKKAKKHCKMGQKYYQDRDKRPDYRHKAVKEFQKCRDYLATLKEPPSLYKEAALMISQINRQLDLMLHQKLQAARRLKSQAKKQKIYQELIRFFPDTTDPRYNKLSKLEGNKSP